MSSLPEAHATLSPTMLPVSRWERLRRFFSLQPFGDEMLTPSAQMWLDAAWILVMAMALLEGCAWGWFGSGVASGWLGVVIGIALGGLAFLIIWALDASLMTSDLAGQGVGKKIFLIVVRLALTGFSVWLTAPYLTQFVFRADIEAELRRDQSLAIDQARQAMAARTEAKLNDLHKTVQADREGLILEVSGRGRSKRYGDGLTSNAIRERILALEAQAQKLERAGQRELAAFNQAVAQGQFELVKVQWGVDIPGDSPVEREARLQRLLQRPEAQRVRQTVEGGFLLVCLALVLFKLFLQNKSLEFYLSEKYQGIWRQYRKGAFDPWLHPLDRSTAPNLLSPLELVQWHETALPRLRRAAQVEEEVRSAREAEQEVRKELAATRAEFEKCHSGYVGLLKQLYEVRADSTERDQDVFELEQFYASEKQKPATSKEHFELLSKLQEVISQQRGVLRGRRREAEVLHFEHSGLVKSYNGLAAQVEALEAEAARKRAERERLEEAVRQVRTELAAVPFEREKVRVPGALGIDWFPEVTATLRKQETFVG